MEKFEMEKFEAPVELDDIELDAVAGGILNDINVAAVVFNSSNLDSLMHDDMANRPLAEMKQLHHYCTG
jgi:hypothetical protein